MKELVSVFFSGVALGAVFGGLIIAAFAWDKGYAAGVRQMLVEQEWSKRLGGVF